MDFILYFRLPSQSKQKNDFSSSSNSLRHISSCLFQLISFPTKSSDFHPDCFLFPFIWLCLHHPITCGCCCSEEQTRKSQRDLESGLKGANQSLCGVDALVEGSGGPAFCLFWNHRRLKVTPSDFSAVCWEMSDTDSAWALLRSTDVCALVPADLRNKEPPRIFEDECVLILTARVQHLTGKSQSL